MSADDTGTITFWFGHDDPDWQSSTARYDFGTFGEHDAGVDVTIVKESDGFLYLAIDIHGRTFRHQEAASPLPTREVPGGIRYGMHFAVTWSRKVVKVYLGGELVASFQV